MAPGSHARWYVAKLIEEIAVQDDPLKVIHRTVTVIYANSEEEAYAKALNLGKEREITYRNTVDKLVRTTFWGLGELNVIHDHPDHGTDFFQEEPAVQRAQPRRRAGERWGMDIHQAPVFAPIDSASHHQEKKLFWE